jgi:uncharacterized DUF497 family protein
MDMDIASKMGIPDHEFRVVFGRTKVDYDPNKDDINRRKHGYSLESAVDFLNHLVAPAGSSRPHAISDAFLEKGEQRHMHLTIDDGDRVVLMVTTMRPDETVRVMSCREASPKERENFRLLTGFVQATD